MLVLARRELCIQGLKRRLEPPGRVVAFRLPLRVAGGALSKPFAEALRFGLGRVGPVFQGRFRRLEERDFATLVGELPAQVVRLSLAPPCPLVERRNPVPDVRLQTRELEVVGRHHAAQPRVAVAQSLRRLRAGRCVLFQVRVLLFHLRFQAFDLGIQLVAGFRIRLKLRHLAPQQVETPRACRLICLESVGFLHQFGAKGL